MPKLQPFTKGYDWGKLVPSSRRSQLICFLHVQKFKGADQLRGHHAADQGAGQLTLKTILPIY